MRTFPPGSAGRNWWGPSWAGYLLNYSEQAMAYDGFNLDGAFHPGFANDVPLENFLPSIFSCPSSTLEKFKENSWTPKRRGYGTYVGIAGAYPDPAGGARIAYLPDYSGYAASNGVLFPNSGVRIAEITDGTTNTLMIGEQSDFIRDASNKLVDMRSCGVYGTFLGANNGEIPNSTNSWNRGSSWPRAFNVTTVRYAINTRSVLPGVSHDVGPNNPLVSVHPGGIMCLRSDGGSTFLSEEIEFDVVRYLSIRDDGQVFVKPF